MGEMTAPKSASLRRRRPDASHTDLESFVDNVCYLRHLTAPFLVCFEWAVGCYWWRYPKANLAILLLTNAVWFQSTSLSLTVMLAVSWAFLSFVGLKTDILTKFLPDARPMPTNDAKAQIYQEYYKSIHFINSVVVEATNRVTSVYEIVRWDDRDASVKAYAVFFALCFVIYLTFAYSAIILFDALMLRNLPRYLGPIIQHHWRLFDNERETEAVAASEQITQAPSSTLQESSSDPLEARDKDVRATTQLEVSNCHSDTPTSSGAKEDQSERYCHGCDSSFGYILNRRNYCRHCGDHFCASCCNQYVPRYFFGATAPAAKTETVMVCRRCYDYLSERLDKRNSSGAMSEESGKQVSMSQPAIN